jgi:hypothetical protein
MMGCLTVTEVEKTQRSLNICHIPDGTVVQYENGRLGLVVSGGLIQLTDDMGEYDFEVFDKSLVAPCKKRLGKLVGITIQKE